MTFLLMKIASCLPSAQLSKGAVYFYQSRLQNAIARNMEYLLNETTFDFATVVSEDHQIPKKYLLPTKRQMVFKGKCIYFLDHDQ